MPMLPTAWLIVSQTPSPISLIPGELQRRLHVKMTKYVIRCAFRLDGDSVLGA